MSHEKIPFAHRFAFWGMQAFTPEASMFHPAKGLPIESRQDAPGFGAGDHGTVTTITDEPEGHDFPAGKALVFLSEHRDLSTWAVDGFLEVPVWELPEQDASDWVERLPASQFRLKLSDALVSIGYLLLKAGLGLLRGRKVGLEVDQVFLERLDGTPFPVEVPGGASRDLNSSESFHEGHGAQSYRSGR